jgi:lysyl-tRNA synthetase class 2
MADTEEPVDAAGGEGGLSKNEQKRRAKQEAAAQAKAEKAAAKAATDAAKPAKPKAAAAAGEDEEEEEEMDAGKYFESRLAYVNGVKAAGGNAYPHKFHTSMQIPAYVAKYGDAIAPGGFAEEIGVSLAGRVLSKRSGGRGLVFFDLTGDGSKVQIFADASKFPEWAGLGKDERNSKFVALMTTLKRGDVVGITGTPGKTRRGELSLFPSAMLLLTPCLHMLPKSVPGRPALVDKETRVSSVIFMTPTR